MSRFFAPLRSLLAISLALQLVASPSFALSSTDGSTLEPAGANQRE